MQINAQLYYHTCLTLIPACYTDRVAWTSNFNVSDRFLRAKLEFRNFFDFPIFFLVSKKISLLLVNFLVVRHRYDRDNENDFLFYNLGSQLEHSKIF